MAAAKNKATEISAAFVSRAKRLNKATGSNPLGQLAQGTVGITLTVSGKSIEKVDLKAKGIGDKSLLLRILESKKEAADLNRAVALALIASKSMQSIPECVKYIPNLLTLAELEALIAEYAIKFQPPLDDPKFRELAWAFLSALFVAKGIKMEESSEEESGSLIL